MWVVRLTDKQLEVLRALLRSEEHLGPALRGSIEALDLARWDDLPEAELPGMAYPLLHGVEGAPREQVGGVHGMPGAAQLAGERADARGQPLCVVEEHYLSHVCPSGQDPAIADGDRGKQGFLLAATG